MAQEVIFIVSFSRMWERTSILMPGVVVENSELVINKTVLTTRSPPCLSPKES